MAPDALVTAGGIWLFCVGLPVVAAVALLVARLRPHVVAVAPWTAAPLLLLAIGTAGEVAVGVPWLLLGTSFAIDQTGRVFLYVSGTLWIVCGLSARAHLGEARARARFCAFFLVSMAGNLGSILAADAVTFFCFFSVMSFASCGLVMHDRRGEASRAGRVYVACIALGEALLFIGIAGIQGHTGFPATSDSPDVSRSGVVFLGFVLAGFGVKLGAVPMHMWAPLAYRAAPIPAAAALSGPMLITGLLGWIRFLPLGGEPLPALGAACVAGGFVSAFWGVLAGLAQRDPRAMLGYSSVSQMGLVMTGIGAGLIAPRAWPLLLPAVWLFAVHHALAKTALVLGVGMAAGAGSGRWTRGPAIAGLVLPALAIAGVPFSSGAAAKSALKHGFEAVPGGMPAAALLLSLASVGTMLLMVRVLVLAWPPRSGSNRSTRPPVSIPWLVLVSAVALWVWVPWWDGLREAVVESVSPARFWSTLWPPAAGLAAAWYVRRAAPLRRLLSGVRVPPGDVLVPLLRAARATRAASGPATRRATRRISLALSAVRPLGRLGGHQVLHRAMQAEAGLHRPDVAGTLVLALTLTLLALLAAGIP